MDGEALRLVERAIARHGGERWSKLEAIELPVLGLSGFLFGMPEVRTPSSP
jgi:hypothetical protein